MAPVPRVRRVYIDISEERRDHRNLGVLITPQEHHFTKTTSDMVVEGEGMNDDDVGKYLKNALGRSRSQSSEPIDFLELLDIQWIMLEAIADVSRDEGIRISPKVLMCALKWEGNEHEQTKLINEAFRRKTGQLPNDRRWLASLAPEYMNVLQEFEFRHYVVGRGVLTHGFRPDRPPAEGTVDRAKLVGQFDYASSKLPEDPGYEVGDIPRPPLPTGLDAGGWQLQ